MPINPNFQLPPGLGGVQMPPQMPAQPPQQQAPQQNGKATFLKNMLANFMVEIGRGMQASVGVQPGPSLQEMRDRHAQRQMEQQRLQMEMQNQQSQAALAVARLKAMMQPKAQENFTLGPGQSRFGANGQVLASVPPEPPKPENLSEPKYEAGQVNLGGKQNPMSVLMNAATSQPQGERPPQGYLGIGPNRYVQQGMFTPQSAMPNKPANRVSIATIDGKVYQVTSDPQGNIVSKTPLGQAGNPNADLNRSDRSYQFHSGQLDKLAQPIRDRAARLSNLVDSINQNSPQADALIAPELLTTMAGGQGSGLRMNEAEISRIVGGRNVWQDIKAKLDRWQADPKKPFSITPEQRKQIGALISTVKQRIDSKQQILDGARQALIAATDPEQHRKILADVNTQLSSVDSGGNSVVVGGKTYNFPNAEAAAGFRKEMGIK